MENNAEIIDILEEDKTSRHREKTYKFIQKQNGPYSPQLQKDLNTLKAQDLIVEEIDYKYIIKVNIGAIKHLVEESGICLKPISTEEDLLR